MPGTVELLQIEIADAGANTVSDVVCELFGPVAVITADCWVVGVPAVAVKPAVVLLVFTLTEDGTFK